MKKRVTQAGIILAFIILAVMSLFFTSNMVKERPIPDIAWDTKEVQLTGWSGNVTYATHEDIIYYFKTDSYDQKHAGEFIRDVSQVMEYMDSAFQGDPIENMKIYVGFQNKEVLTRKNIMVMEEENLTTDTLWQILKKRTLEVLNAGEQYGLVYAYCLENGIGDNCTGQSKDVKEQLKAFFEKKENRTFLDFTIPMLEDVYFSDEEAEQTKLAVKEFAAWYMNKYSIQELENLCKEAGAGEKTTINGAKNEWLESIGCDAVYEELSKIPFQYNNYTEVSNKATYKIEAEDAVWLWNDDDVKGLGYIYMVENYNLLEPLRVEDFAEARAYLEKYLPENLGKVKIKTNFVNSDITSWNEYIPATESIEIVIGWIGVPHSLLHEYIHYLTIGPGKLMKDQADGGDLLGEWYTVALANMELKNREREMLPYYESVDGIKEERAEWDYENDCYCAALGCTRYTMKRYYEKAAESIAKGGTEQFWVSFGSLNYSEIGTLAYYIIQTYGFDSLVKLAKNGVDFEDATGKSLTTLYFDMIDWLKPQLEGDEWLEKKGYI